MNTETKNCQNCKNLFAIEPADFAFYEKMQVPPPALCPQCRFMRRCLFRNERTLYNHTCDLCKKRIISMYNPKSPYTVYCVDCYESDTWNSAGYAMPYNASRSFFEQLGELFKKVPKKGMYITTGLGPNVNSEYTNVAGGNKNCYLLFNAGRNDSVRYSRGILDSRDSADLYFGSKLERCYECVNVHQSAGVMWSRNVTASMDSGFLLNCSGCQNCFGCVNLRHASYHFLNKPLPKDAYEAKVKEIKGSFSKMQEFRRDFETFSLQFPRKENGNFKAVGSTGDYLSECKNVQHSFEAERCEDCKYLFSNKIAKDCYDLVGYGYNAELLLECVAVGCASRVIGSYGVENSYDIEYCFSLKSCENCFGCDGLKNASHCILNARYAEPEYARMRSQIIEELKRENAYGLCMPPALAPFGYNETVGQDNVPLTKEQALAQGFRWEDNIQMTRGKETMQLEQMPDHIRDVPDSIINELFACATCGRNWRIIAAELAFYRSMALPLPRTCFNCRFLDRIKRRGPFMFYVRTCAKCQKPIQTTYTPERPEIVYCEACYQQEVV